MTEVIKWNNKEYKMPFDADYNRQKADSFKEEIIVKNRFNNEPALLPWFAVADVTPSQVIPQPLANLQFCTLESKSFPTTGVSPLAQLPKPKGLLQWILPFWRSTLKKSGHLLVSGGNLADVCADLMSTPTITKERISKINAIINTTFWKVII